MRQTNVLLSVVNKVMHFVIGQQIHRGGSSDNALGTPDRLQSLILTREMLKAAANLAQAVANASRKRSIFEQKVYDLGPLNAGLNLLAVHLIGIQ